MRENDNSMLKFEYISYVIKMINIEHQKVNVSDPE